MSDPEQPRILRGATVHGEVVMSVDGTVVSVHGIGGPMTGLRAEKGEQQIFLPSQTIMGASPRSGKYVAWDGERYVFRPTLESISTDEDLMLIGRVKRLKKKRAIIGKNPDIGPSVIEKPNTEAKVAERPARFSPTISSPSAARKMEAYMNAKGLDQTEFSIQAKTTDKTIRKFRQTGKVKRSILVGIAAAMGISREELLR